MTKFKQFHLPVTVCSFTVSLAAQTIPSGAAIDTEARDVMAETDARGSLPGAGYAALHPELKDVDPVDYPDITKMAILADVAPYSREYNQVFPSSPTTKNLAHARARDRIPGKCFCGLAPAHLPR